MLHDDLFKLTRRRAQPVRSTRGLQQLSRWAVVFVSIDRLFSLSLSLNVGNTNVIA
jgi:hypothetical protein